MLEQNLPNPTQCVGGGKSERVDVFGSDASSLSAGYQCLDPRVRRHGGPEMSKADIPRPHTMYVNRIVPQTDPCPL